MSEKKTLAVPVFIKVKDLEKARSGFNVYAKVADVKPKNIQTRDGQTIPMVDCLLVDETASVKAFFKGANAKQITDGAVIAVRNGLKRYVQNRIIVQVDIFGRVTEEKAVKIDAGANLANISDVEHILEKRAPRDNRRDYNRGGRRTGGRREGDDRRGDRREDRGPRRQPRQDRDREYKRNDRDQGRKPEKTETDKPAEKKAERKEERNNDKPERDNRGTDRRDNAKPYERRDNRDYDRRDNRDTKPYERRDNRDDRRDNRDTKPYERRDNRDYDRRDNRDTKPYERRDNRQYDNRRNYDQDYNRGNTTRNETRPARQYEQKRQENRQGRAPFQWARIKQIGPGETRLNLNVQVISVVKVGRNSRVIIGDNSGVSNAFLHDSEDLVAGESIVLFNAKAEVVKEHIEIQLERGGRFERSRKPVVNVNNSFNLSEKAWVPVE